MKKQIPKLELGEEAISNLCTYYQIGAVHNWALIEQGKINTNYHVVTDEAECVFRIYSFRKESEVKEEVELLNHLRRNGFSCHDPIRGDGYVTTIQDRPVVCCDYIAGHQPARSDNVVGQVGRKLGQLHNIGQGFDGLSREGEALDRMLKLLAEIEDELIDSSFRNADRFCSFLAEEFASLEFPDNLPQGVIHSDLKPENVVAQDREVTGILDFDNAYRDAFIVDIGSTVVWWCFEGEEIDGEMIQALLKGYTEERELGQEEKGCLVDAVRFNLLKQAFKYAYICLPDLEFAEEQAYQFMQLYREFDEADLHSSVDTVV